MITEVFLKPHTIQTLEAAPAAENIDANFDAIWWALVTLTTVGYGDIVPQAGWGRLIGAFVMVLGVTFLSFLTATVTSLRPSSGSSQPASIESVARC